MKSKRDLKSTLQNIDDAGQPLPTDSPPATWASPVTGSNLATSRQLHIVRSEPVTEADEDRETTLPESELDGEHLAEPTLNDELARPAASTAGPRPLFQLPFLCGQEWIASTRGDHKPNPNSLDMQKVGGGSNGQPILASAAGRVVRSPDTPDDGGGWYVRIDHGNGWQTRYLHMIERPPVRVDQQVARGQVIGHVGSTGHSSAPHLHYEQIADGITVRSAFDGVLVTVDISHEQRLISKNCGGAALAVIYAIQHDGALLWYRHEGREDGSFAWSGPKPVGTGWQDAKTVFTGGNGILYAIQLDGALLWYRHEGYSDGSFAWSGPKPVGTGWQDTQDVFAGGNGIIYKIQSDGTLLWYRHEGYSDGSFAWTGPNPVGTGWQDFKTVFAGGDGIIYAIQPDGALLWYRHEGYSDGSFAWNGPNPVGTGWQDAKAVFTGGNGILYAIQPDGALLWYRHEGYSDGSFAWSGPKPVGTGWQDFKYVFGL